MGYLNNALVARLLHIAQECLKSMKKQHCIVILIVRLQQTLLIIKIHYYLYQKFQLWAHIRRHTIFAFHLVKKSTYLPFLNHFRSLCLKKKKKSSNGHRDSLLLQRIFIDHRYFFSLSGKNEKEKQKLLPLD